MEIFVRCLGESQSGTKLAGCQEPSVRGDGSAKKIQADFLLVGFGLRMCI